MDSVTFDDIKALFRETSAQFKETDKKFLETDKKIDKLGKLIGSISNNNADMAEDFFYNTLASNLEVGKLKFDYIGRNAHRRRHGVEREYDIVLYNEEKVVVVEVKYKLHPEDVKRFLDKKLPKFRILYPEYNHCKLYAGVAGLSVTQEAVEMAKNMGLFVLQSQNDEIRLANDEDFEPTAF